MALHSKVYLQFQDPEDLPFKGEFERYKMIAKS